MRRLRYDVLPPVGAETLPVEGTVIDLLVRLHHLSAWEGPLGRSFPSRDRLNRRLRKGAYDAGMSGGCEWEPFELNPEEYEEVAEAIKHDPRVLDGPSLPQATP